MGGTGGERFGDTPGRLRRYVVLAAVALVAGVALTALSYRLDAGWAPVPLVLALVGLSALLTAPLMRRSVTPHAVWAGLTAGVAVVVTALVFLFGPALQRAAAASPQRLSVPVTQVWTTGSGGQLVVHGHDGTTYWRLTPDGRPGPAVPLGQRAPSVTGDGARLVLRSGGLARHTAIRRPTAAPRCMTRRPGVSSSPWTGRWSLPRARCCSCAPARHATGAR